MSSFDVKCVDIGDWKIMNENKWVSVHDKAIEYPAWVQWPSWGGSAQNVALRMIGAEEEKALVTHWQPAIIPSPMITSSWLRNRLKQIPQNDECGFWNGAREAIQEAIRNVFDMTDISRPMQVRITGRLRKIIGE